MLYLQKSQQVSYGEAIGILLLDSPVPFIPGDVANATTYDFPVRFKKVPGFSVEKALGRDESIYPDLLKAARDLKENGVRAVTGDCGFMAVHQNRLKQDLGIPVFLSSLLQVPFIRQIIPDDRKIGVITASKQNLTPSFLELIGIKDMSGLVIEGLENSPEFKSTVLDEKGSLDTGKIQAEVVNAAKILAEDGKNVNAILMECSVLPPYAHAVHKETRLPVFDYITMINFVFSAVVKKTYSGFM
ncbi:MAG: aspartate/glutamate racemase family protein [Deltaproteobacteria bacterium]|nr:aspartate/glutamate racemase family protein [Deltaproteobacteria bacterium]